MKKLSEEFKYPRAVNQWNQISKSADHTLKMSLYILIMFRVKNGSQHTRKTTEQHISYDFKVNKFVPITVATSLVALVSLRMAIPCLDFNFASRSNAQSFRPASFFLAMYTLSRLAYRYMLLMELREGRSQSEIISESLLIFLFSTCKHTRIFSVQKLVKAILKAV